MKNGKNIYSKDTQYIRDRLETLRESDEFHGGDYYLIRKVVPLPMRNHLLQDGCTPEALKELRTKAYRYLTKAYKSQQEIFDDKMPSPKTLRKWCGLEEESARPKRRQAFQLAFLLHFAEEELAEYLKEGLLQPGVQINDYQEMIWLYGIHNNLTYDECVDMIRIYEKHAGHDKAIEQNTHTEILWRMYRENCDLDKAEFMRFLCENVSFFKGYSKRVLAHFIDLKKEILSEIRVERKKELLQELHKTSFYAWAKENNIEEEDYAEEIQKFLRNMARRKESEIPRELAEILSELYWIVYTSKDRATDLLAELYASAFEAGTSEKGKQHLRYKDRKRFNLPKEITFMRSKDFSQIIGIAQQKEKEIRLSQALTTLDDCEQCPDWIRNLLSEYRIPYTDDIEKLRKIIDNSLAGQKQRCHLIRREDLLPLIHYVAQKRYENELREDDGKYDQQTARDYFINFANEIFHECEMAPVNEHYQLDYLLLSCYGEEDMYSYSDLLEKTQE